MISYWLWEKDEDGKKSRDNATILYAIYRILAIDECSGYICNL